MIVEKDMFLDVDGKQVGMEAWQQNAWGFEPASSIIGPTPYRLHIVPPSFGIMVVLLVMHINKVILRWARLVLGWVNVTCVARIFRVWVRPGVNPGFLVRMDNEGADGPEWGTIGATALMGWGLEKGVVTPQDGVSQICALSL